MKKLLFLLAAVGTVFTACQSGSLDDGSNGGNSSGNSEVYDPNNPLNNKKCSNNEILYISKSCLPMELGNYDGWGAKLVSNTYENGVGRLKFDAAVTTIAQNAFKNNNLLKYIKMPDSVTSIGDEAFAFCSSLTSVTIGNSVTSIGDYAFYKCTSLTSVTIGNSVTSIGDSAFGYCISLTAFYGKFASADNRCLIVDGVLNSFAPAGLTEYSIPDSVTSIGKEAFEYCTSLTSVTIPNSVVSIGTWAFYKCTSLISITIPDSITSIGKQVFGECASLKAFYGKYASADNRCLIVDGVLNSFAPAGLTEYTIPDSVTSIGEYAFFCCTSLTSITIPDSVTEIGNEAFFLCTSLTNVSIPDGVAAIGNYAFENCYSLTNVTIPNGVTSIGDNAFASCTSLTNVTIPNGITSIGDNAFANCTSLTSVYCKPTTPPTGGWYMFSYYYNNGNVHYYTPIGCKIYVPTASVDAYKAADGWSNYARYIVGYDF